MKRWSYYGIEIRSLRKVSNTAIVGAVLFLAVTGLVADSSIVQAQTAAEAREAAKSIARERAKASAKAQPLWDKPVNNEMIIKYRLTTNGPVVGKTLQQLITTDAGTLQEDASLRSDGQNCVSCHGITNFRRNGIDLRGKDARYVCNLIPGFKSNRTKPQYLKNFLGEWRDFGCQSIGDHG